jgi:hypothetical protein
VSSDHHLAFLCDGTGWDSHPWERMQYMREYAEGCSIYACGACGHSMLVRDDSPKRCTCPPPSFPYQEHDARCPLAGSYVPEEK